MFFKREFWLRPFIIFIVLSLTVDTAVAIAIAAYVMSSVDFTVGLGVLFAVTVKQIFDITLGVIFIRRHSRQQTDRSALSAAS